MTQAIGAIRYLIIPALLASLLAGSRISEPETTRTEYLEDLGLVWQECTLAHEPMSNVAEATCFGHDRLPLSGSEWLNFGRKSERFDMFSDQYLVVGADAYVVKAGHKNYKLVYTMYKNDIAIQLFTSDLIGAMSPSLTLQNVAGKIVWEYIDVDGWTVTYDRLDVRRLYDLDAAYRPFGMAGKLIFIGRKADKYFIMYDGHKIGPDFDDISITLCCEAAYWSVDYGQGKYVFWGERGGQWFVVQIAPMKQ